MTDREMTKQERAAMAKVWEDLAKGYEAIGNADAARECRFHGANGVEQRFADLYIAQLALESGEAEEEAKAEAEAS